MEPSNLALFWAAVLACSILLYVFLDGAGVNPIITLWIAFVAGVPVGEPGQTNLVKVEVAR